MGRRTIVIGALLALGGCWSVDHLSADFGEDDGGVVGSVDAATSDALLGPDGGNETGSNGCPEGPHAVCADFDGDDWQKTLETAQDPVGFVGRDGSRSTSAPFSLRTSLAESSVGFHLATATQFVASPWRPTRMAFDIYLRSPVWRPGDANVTLFALSFAPASTSAISTTFFIGATGGTVTVLGPGYQTFSTSSLPLDRWVHVRLDVTPDATNGLVSLLFDGQSVASRAGLIFDTSMRAADGAGVRAVLGLQRFNPPTPAIDCYFDNLTVDFF